LIKSAATVSRERGKNDAAAFYPRRQLPPKAREEERKKKTDHSIGSSKRKGKARATWYRSSFTFTVSGRKRVEKVREICRGTMRGKHSGC